MDRGKGEMPGGPLRGRRAEVVQAQAVFFWAARYSFSATPKS